MFEKSIILILLNFMIISLSGFFALDRLDIFYKQLLFWLIGFLFIIISFFVDWRFIFDKYFQISIIALSYFILILVLFTSSDLKSWFNFFGFSIQSSEFSKLGFFLFLNYIISKYSFDFIYPVYLVYPILIVLSYVFLIILQPDWGMAFLYISIWFFVMLNFLSKKEILALILIGILILSFLWFFVLKDYQKNRIIILFNPESDYLKSGYNLRQIKLVLSTSSFFGKGVGLGEISRLGYLPSAHTDFILVSLIEERGIFIFIIYSFLIFLLIYKLKIMIDFQKNPIIKNFIFIVQQYFLVKYIITTLVNFGISPIIGLPVPFLSYGGSHLIFDVFLLSVVISLTKQRI